MHIFILQTNNVYTIFFSILYDNSLSLSLSLYDPTTQPHHSTVATTTQKTNTQPNPLNHEPVYI